MNFLLIGASGFLGGHLLRHLRQQGAEVIGTCRRGGTAGLVSFDLSQGGIRQVVPDTFFIGEPVFAVLSAFVSQIDYCFQEKEKSRKANVEGMIALLKDLYSVGAVPVFISTSAVFDGSVGNYTEEDAVGPINEYGRHKLAVENYIRQQNKPALILRCDKLIGDNGAEGHMLSDWVRQAKEGHPIICIKDQIMSPTLVEDVARAVFLACSQRLTGLFHVANPEHFLREDLARLFVHAMGLPVSVQGKTQEELGFLDFRSLRAHLNPSRFIQTTGFQFSTIHRIFDSFARSVGIKNASGTPRPDVCGR